MKIPTIVVAVFVALAFAAMGVTASYYLAPEPTLAQSAAGDMIVSSSTTARAGVELTLTIDSLPMSPRSGSSVVLYLEDDFLVPDSIDRNAVYFTVSNPFTANTNNGGPVAPAGLIQIYEGDYFRGGDDWAIRAFIPDMNSGLAGYQGPVAGQTVNLVFTEAAGIKNPGEAHDSSNTYTNGYKASYTVLNPNESVPDAPADNTVDDLIVEAKISLSDNGNRRGYELTVTGSGFNNGTSAAVHVLHKVVNDPDDRSTWPSCAEVIAQGARGGIATVASDDRVAVSFEVTVPPFMVGKNNYLCMVDGEGRMSATDVEQFHLEPFISVVPGAVVAGGVVTVFAYDFPNPGAGLTSLKIAGQEVFAPSVCKLMDSRGNVVYDNCVSVLADSIGADGSAIASFQLPGNLNGAALHGTLRLDVQWGTIRENSRIVVLSSKLSLSSRVVTANETIVIWGEQFGDSPGCLVSATISGAPLKLISEDDVRHRDCIDVEVSESGQFAATVAIWSDSRTNPALTPGQHIIEVVSYEGFTGEATILIREPAISVSPAVASPGEYITLSGENWPVSSDSYSQRVSIEIGGRQYNAAVDQTGQFTLEHQVGADVAVDSGIRVLVRYGSELTRATSVWVPKNKIIITPQRARPGERITLQASNMPRNREVSSINVAGHDVLGRKSFASDGDGNVTAEGILVPDLPPGTYIVRMGIGVGDIRGILDVLPEEHTPTNQPALAPTGNIAVRDGASRGEVIVSWDAVPGATYYRIGYVNMETDYPLATASITGEWLEAFVYVDVNAANLPPANGRVAYTLRRLEPGVRHAITVLTSNDVVNTKERFGGQYFWPSNPRWRFHTVR